MFMKRQLLPKSTATIVGIFAIVMSLSILFQIGIIAPAHALSHYFNCIIRAANKSGDLTVANVETCYDKVFKAASTKQASDIGNNIR